VVLSLGSWEKDEQHLTININVLQNSVGEGVGWDVDTSFGTICGTENGHGTGNWDGVAGDSCKGISEVQIRCGESKGDQVGQGSRLHFFSLEMEIRIKN
jgi:hypothetical protein